MLEIICIIITLKSKEFDTHIQFVRMKGMAVYMSLASVDIEYFNEGLIFLMK